MSDESSKSWQKLAPPDVRDKALGLFRAKGYRARQEVEELLGWDGLSCMTRNRMARQLGLTVRQLKYLEYRKEERESDRKRLLAKKEAKKIELIEHQSTLNFKISFPPSWSVTVDGYQSDEDIHKLIDIFYKEYLKSSPNKPLSKKTFGIRVYKHIDSFKFGVHAENVGAYSAAPLNALGDVSLDVVRILFDTPIEPIELYKLDKLPQEEVSWGTRKSGQADGMPGTKYYYNPIGTTSKYYNLYLTDKSVGWIISCVCDFRFFDKYKPIFDRIISSFKRI